MNAACFMDNLNFSTCRFPQALEFWVEILNFSKMTSENIVCLAKPDFLLFRTNGKVAWFLLTKPSTV